MSRWIAIWQRSKSTSLTRSSKTLQKAKPCTGSDTISEPAGTVAADPNVKSTTNRFFRLAVSQDLTDFDDACRDTEKGMAVTASAASQPPSDAGRGQRCETAALTTTSGSVFAKEWGDLHGRKDSLGFPLEVSHLGQREFGRIIKAAGVPVIKFDGLRHTTATLLLAAGEPVHVVSARLGHSRLPRHWRCYAHALPSHGRAAAARLGAILHGAC